jgi:hypothetical protein
MISPEALDVTSTVRTGSKTPVDEAVTMTSPRSTAATSRSGTSLASPIPQAAKTGSSSAASHIFLVRIVDIVQSLSLAEKSPAIIESDRDRKYTVYKVIRGVSP